MATGSTGSSTTPPTRYEHPFHKASADVVLRSSDGDDFRVHRLILSEASSVFEGMFSLPQPTDAPVEHATEGKDTPVVEVPENSRTLDRLLRHCYPMSRPALNDLKEVVSLLEALKKYEMDEVAKDVCGVLLDGRFRTTIEDAFAVYAALWRLDFNDNLADSARATFSFNLPSFASPVLQSMPPAAIFALMEFRARCVGAATDFVLHPSDWNDLEITRWAGTEYEVIRPMTLEELDPDDESVRNTRPTVRYGCRRCVWGTDEYGNSMPDHTHTFLLQLDEEDVRDEFIRNVQARPCGQALANSSVSIRGQLYCFDNEHYWRHRDSPCVRCIADGVQTVSEVLGHLGNDLDERLRRVPFDKPESQSYDESWDI
ncbi:hypothetical protein DAEQUDRAFT_273983 [Daedalea quercina L-15889]|uniref:BTB domain-containing protein n=1 Tax=Daedalea quercina L-15889 TaxID=1314783 RepID=A0A165QE32_9APHY|nr:hypothetical protein DAEQUDRAFT_273983 [Daedalea quercina L-15889]